MRLVVDTSVLAGELLRATGRQRLGDERLDLFLAEQMWNETRIELPRKIGTITPAHKPEPAEADHLVDVAIAAVDANPTELDEAVYAAAGDEARAKVPTRPDRLAGRRLRPPPQRRHLDQRQRLPRRRRSDLDDCVASAGNHAKAFLHSLQTAPAFRNSRRCVPKSPIRNPIGTMVTPAELSFHPWRHACRSLRPLPTAHPLTADVPY